MDLFDLRSEVFLLCSFFFREEEEGGRQSDGKESFDCKMLKKKYEVPDT
jgi:hypothetical protein